MTHNKLSLRKLIFFLSISLFTIISVNAIFSYYSSRHISKQVAEITQYQIPLLNKVHTLESLNIQKYEILDKLAITNNALEQQRQFRNVMKNIDVHLNQTLYFFDQISNENEHYNDYLSQYKSLHLFQEQQLAFLNDMNDFFENPQTKERAMVMMDAQKERDSKIVEDLQMSIQNLSENRERYEDRLQSQTLILSTLAIIIIFALTYLTLSISTRKLHQISDSLSTTFQSVSRASDELYDLSVQISNGAHEQASSVEKVASTLEQMAAMTQENSKSTLEIDSMSTRTKELAALGNRSVDRLQDAMQNILNSSKRTEEIVNTIQEIAFQTNVLSLNASVEATKAGEAGKGFIVVANEVRDLAQRTSQGAKNIISLIDESRRYVEEGVTSVTEVQTTFDNIFNRIQKLAETTKAIANALSEQVSGVEQVKSSVEQIDHVVQLNVANTQEGATAAEKLHAQSYELEQTIQDLRTIVYGDTM